MNERSVPNDCLLFAGSSHPGLAKEIADCLGIPLGSIDIDRFPDGEVSVEIKESVRNRNVFVVQTVALEPDRYLFEMLVIIDALKRASAKRIVAVIPYYGYCRQDRKDRPRVPITAKLVANLIEKAGATRLLTMDLHALQIEGFFDIPVDVLRGPPLLMSAIRSLELKDLVVVAPDIGSVKVARLYAHDLQADFAVIDKRRNSSFDVDLLNLIGEVKGKDVLLADDMCSTGGTLVSAAKACQEKGARRIIAAVTHGIFVGSSVEAIFRSPIEKVLMSNTIPYTDRLDQLKGLHIVSVAPLFSQAIDCILSAGSISSMSCPVCE